MNLYPAMERQDWFRCSLVDPGGGGGDKTVRKRWAPNAAAYIACLWPPLSKVSGSTTGDGTAIICWNVIIYSCVRIPEVYTDGGADWFRFLVQ